MQTVQVVERIAKAYSALSRADGGARWRWAKQILALRDAQPEKKRSALDKEIGAECAKAVGRDKPYSPQWVRAYVNAARQFQSEPTTAEQAAEFLALCNNAQSKSEAKSEERSEEAETKKAGTKEDALRMLASAAKLARKRGASDLEIAQAMTGSLSSKGGN
jgi:hypothetical protein